MTRQRPSAGARLAGLRDVPGISLSDLRVNGFEALNDGGCREPPDAFPGADRETGA